jgi:hypothetical protein
MSNAEKLPEGFARSMVNSMVNEAGPGKVGNNGWQGLGATLEDSLEEHGFIAKPEGGRWHVIYSAGEDQYDHEDHYDHVWIREKELDRLIKGYGWADEYEIESFLRYIGMDRESWLKKSFLYKFSDLLSYWGYEDFMGPCDHPLSEKDVWQIVRGTKRIYGD